MTWKCAAFPLIVFRLFGQGLPLWAFDDKVSRKSAKGTKHDNKELSSRKKRQRATTTDNLIIICLLNYATGTTWVQTGKHSTEENEKHEKKNGLKTVRSGNTVEWAQWKKSVHGKNREQQKAYTTMENNNTNTAKLSDTHRSLKMISLSLCNFATQIHHLANVNHRRDLHSPFHKLPNWLCHDRYQSGTESEGNHDVVPGASCGKRPPEQQEKNALSSLSPSTHLTSTT